MTKNLKVSALLMMPAVIASSVVVSSSAFASEVSTPSIDRSVSVAELEKPVNLRDSLDQVTSVSQLSDVQPTDWAFQALQSLVERYGCIAGYPNRTYRGNRPLTRYEFAAGLNACMDRVNELIASATADTVKKEDLEAIKKLQEEFGTELATLRGQVDSLEARTKTLEAQQFSTTTKLSGEVIFALAQTFGSDRAVSRRPQTGANAAGDLQENTVFANRVRLNFDASFTGTDRLRVRLQAANIPNFNGVTGTNESRLSFDTNTSNNVQIDDLYYRFNPTPTTRIFVSAASSEFNDFFNTLNPGLESSGSGALSRFGRYSSIYRSGEGAGVAVIQSFLDKRIVLNAGYLAGGANGPSTVAGSNAGQGASDPSNGFGLFNGNYAALGQLEITPVKPLTIGLTYARAYQNRGVNVTGSLGSDAAIQPFGANVPTRSNQFQVAANLRVTKRLTLTGSGTYVNAFGERTVGGVRRTDSADIWSWFGAISYKDLGRTGSNLGLIFGSPSGARQVDRSLTTGATARDLDTAYHIELLYRLPITDNIAITPGFFTIINPESNARNSAIYVGTVRTTFSF